jgi:hypothetical protein
MRGIRKKEPGEGYDWRKKTRIVKKGIRKGDGERENWEKETRIGQSREIGKRRGSRRMKGESRR